MARSAAPVRALELVVALAASLASACQDVRRAGSNALPSGVTGREPVVGLPCEGCEAVFEGLPAAIPTTARLAPPDEPGQPLRIDGVVRDLGGAPVAGVILYAHHTDVHGIYPPDERAPGEASRRHGRLRGWVQSDAQGRYAFETIRPGGYPDSDIPEHVHMQVLEPGRCTYFIEDLVFTDDARMTPAARPAATVGIGGDGLCKPVLHGDARWYVRRDIVLGRGVPHYPPR